MSRPEKIADRAGSGPRAALCRLMIQNISWSNEGSVSVDKEILNF